MHGARRSACRRRGACASAQRGARRVDAFGDMAELGEDRRQAAGRARAPSPTRRLRDRLPVQVSTRSPRPARPISVSRRPPSAADSRPHSARPRVMSAARALSPKPSPSLAPAAIASTFFIAPPTSTPGEIVTRVRAQGIAAQQRRDLARSARRRWSRRPAPSASPARPPRRMSAPKPTPTGCGHAAREALMRQCPVAEPPPGAATNPLDSQTQRRGDALRAQARRTSGQRCATGVAASNRSRADRREVRRDRRAPPAARCAAGSAGSRARPRTRSACAREREVQRDARASPGRASRGGRRSPCPMRPAEHRTDASWRAAIDGPLLEAEDLREPDITRPVRRDGAP